jgi:hypothetical protein
MSKVEIELKPNNIGSIVSIDGVKVPGIRSIELTATAREVTRLKLVLLPTTGVTIQGDADALIEELVPSFDSPVFKEFRSKIENRAQKIKDNA